MVLKKAQNKAEIEKRVHENITDFANRGFRSLGIAKSTSQVRFVSVSSSPQLQYALLPFSAPDVAKPVPSCHVSLTAQPGALQPGPSLPFAAPDTRCEE